MSQPSDWPLDPKSVRLVSPVIIRRQLEQHILTRDCFPLAIGYYERAYSHSMSRTRHDDNILIYCFDGQGYLETDSWKGTINSGELVLLPSSVGHRYRADSENPWSIYWCHFSGDLAGDYLSHIGTENQAGVISIGHSPALIGQFQALLQATSNGFAQTAMIHAANMLKQLLTGIALIVEQKSEQTENRFDVEAIQAFMLQNLDKPLDLDVLV